MSLRAESVLAHVNLSFLRHSLVSMAIFATCDMNKHMLQSKEDEKQPTSETSPLTTVDRVIDIMAKEETMFSLWRYNLRKLICMRAPIDQSSFSNTEISVAIVVVCLMNLERNMRWAGFELSSRHYCWSDMQNRESSAISEAVAYLLRQNLVTYVQENAASLLDPSGEKLMRAVAHFEGGDKGNRCLFVFNGHGTPKPLKDGELCLPSESGFGETPLSVKELVEKFDIPGCFIFDCDFAGSLYQVFKGMPEKDMFAFFACGPDETLTHRLGLPADLFTSCLLTPALISLLWGSRQFYAFKKGGLHQFPLSYFTDENGIKPHLLSFSFEIERLLRCLVKAMAYGAMEPKDLFNIFFRDAKAGKLFIHFCVAKRIGAEIGFTPMSYPEIPDFSRHPLWEFFDLYLDRVLLRLMEIDNGMPVSQQQINGDMAAFLSDGLLAVEYALDLKFSESNPSELALLPMMLCEPALHSRAVVALTKFIDTGEVALKAGLCYGLLPIILSMPYRNEPELLLAIGYIVAKFLCFAFKNEQGQLAVFTCSGAQVVASLMANVTTASSEYMIIAIIIMIAGMQIDPDEEIEKIPQAAFQTVLSFVSSKDLMLQFWSLLFIGEYVSCVRNLEQFSQPVAETLLSAHSGQLAETRCAFLFAFDALVDYDDANVEKHLKIWLDIVKSFDSEPSQLVRMQELLLTQKILERVASHSTLTLAEQAKQTAIDRLNVLANDPHPEICEYAQQLLTKVDSPDDWSHDAATTLLNSSVDQFLAVNFSEIRQYKRPPFCMEPSIPPIMPCPSAVNIGSSSEKRSCRGVRFTEIDHTAPGRKITTNLAFYGGEKVMFGDSDGNITIRNYTDHNNEFCHNWESFFSTTARKHRLQTLVPIAQDVVLCMTSNGDITILANVMVSCPTIADNFRLVPEIAELEQRPTVDYDCMRARVYGSGETGVIHPIDIRSGCTIPKFSVSAHPIKKLKVMPKCDGLLGVASQDLAFVDIRDTASPVITASGTKAVIDFEPMRSEGRDTSVIVAYDDDTVSCLDLRRPEEQMLLLKQSSISAVDACYWGDYALVAGRNVLVVDINNKGATYSAIDGMYPTKQRPTDITSAAFHTSKPALGFVVQETAVVIAGVLMEF